MHFEVCSIHFRCWSVVFEAWHAVYALAPIFWYIYFHIEQRNCAGSVL